MAEMVEIGVYKSISDIFSLFHIKNIFVKTFSVITFSYKVNIRQNYFCF